jgi:hypothetical protein
MEKYGFIYVWFDKKHRRFYVGAHWGLEDDGYICSSTWMRNAFKRRPNDFKRRIIKRIYSSKLDTFIQEQHYLNMIKPEEKKTKYYNIQLSVAAYIESLRKDDRRDAIQKMKDTKKKYWDSPESDTMKQQVSDFHKKRGTKPPSQKGRVPWNKGLTKDTDPRVAANSLSLCKPKRKRTKPISEETRRLVSDNMKAIWAERNKMKQKEII